MLRSPDLRCLFTHEAGRSVKDGQDPSKRPPSVLEAYVTAAGCGFLGFVALGFVTLGVGMSSRHPDQAPGIWGVLQLMWFPILAVVGLTCAGIYYSFKMANQERLGWAAIAAYILFLVCYTAFTSGSR
jgi:hypothetical protein